MEQFLGTDCVITKAQHGESGDEFYEGVLDVVNPVPTSRAEVLANKVESKLSLLYIRFMVVVTASRVRETEGGIVRVDLWF